MRMNKAFKELFGSIRAEEELKLRTRTFLEKKTQGYTRTSRATRANTKRHRYYLYAAACASLLLFFLGGHWLYFTPTAEISIDINPSIELSVNRFDRVIFVNAFNEEGQKLSDTLDVKYKSYEEAVREIIHYDGITALLSDDEVMTITVIASDEQQSAKILSNVQLCTANQSNTYCYFARSEEVAAAHETGLSCGKYKAFLELQLLDPEITPETVRDMTMREIRELIERLSADDENSSSSDNYQGNGHQGTGSGQGNGHGHGNGYGNGNGNGNSSGSGCGNGSGNRRGHGSGSGHNGNHD